MSEEPAAPSSGDEAKVRSLSRRSLLWSAVYLAGVYGGVRWLASRRDLDGVPWPFRRALGATESVWSDAFPRDRLVPTYPESRIDAERQNGDEGLSDDFDPSQWSLAVEGVFGHDDPLSLSLEEIQKLPQVEMVTELFCIEGWSVVQKWKGARFVDFAAKYPPNTSSGDAPDVMGKPDDLVPYVGMETPDGGYYVGLDMASALHPQTLLCWEMNGKPLAPEHGAPLRLVIPVKYGVKNIKRIGTIRYAAERPKDYWAEQGYDWFCGL